MSHFAKVENGVVTQVIVAEADFIATGALGDPASWVQTSYNTIGNQHTQGGTPLRGNYAGVGYTYDAEHDVFIAPKPADNAILNMQTWLWELPAPVEPAQPAQQWSNQPTPPTPTGSTTVTI